MPWAADPRLIQSLLSSYCWMVGQLETPDLYLQIAFPFNQPDHLYRRNILEHGHFLLSIRIPDDAAQGFAVPSIQTGEQTAYNWHIVGERLTDLAAIWYGKRFDYHGTVTEGSIATLPNLSTLSTTITPSDLAPYNSDLRPDLNVELNLAQLQGVLRLLYIREPEEKVNAFWTAVRFYANALRVFETDPEMAFFHFVVALETISSQIEIPYVDLYDEQTRQDLEDIGRLVSPQAANRVEQRLQQVKRRVVFAVKNSLNRSFFEGSRAGEGFRLLPDRIEACVKAIYDLRSRYAHSGAIFGTWFTIQIGGPTAEVNVGHPVLPRQQQALERLLADIPTFVGLERIVRFTVLSFAHHYLEPIHPGLQREEREEQLVGHQ